MIGFEFRAGHAVARCYSWAGEEFSPDGKNNNRIPKKKPDGARPEPKPKPRAVSAEKGQAGVVKKLLRKVEQKLSGDEVKASLGDYIRLVQLQKELEDEQPKEMKVTWVKPEETGSDSGK
jgi:hypothetical protein